MIELAMPTFDENGFLDGRIQFWVESQRVSHRKLIERAQELNRDCHRFLDGRALSPGNGKQIATSLLFARLLELYQSIILVSERGMAATLAATQIPPPVATLNSPTLNDRTGA
jgi:hypothetical protein